MSSSCQHDGTGWQRKQLNTQKPGGAFGENKEAQLPTNYLVRGRVVAPFKPRVKNLARIFVGPEMS